MTAATNLLSHGTDTEISKLWQTVQMFEYLEDVTIKSAIEYVGDVTTKSVIEYLGDVTIKSVIEYSRATSN